MQINSIQIQKPYNKSVIINKIWKTIYRDNRNYVGLMQGRPGTGKSYSAATILKAVDPTFHVNRIFFTLEQLFDFIAQTPPKGTAFMLDEAGVAVNYRRWYSKGNEKIMDLIQTWRHYGWVFIMIAPSQRLIDKVNHPFFDQMMETVNIYRSLGFARIKVKEPTHNTQLNKFYYKHLTTPVEMGEFRNAKITSVMVQYPGRNFSIHYEKRKKEFTEMIRNRGKFELSGTDKNVAEDTTVKRLSPMQEVIYNKLWEGKAKPQIAEELKISLNYVRFLAHGIKLKGHQLPHHKYKFDPAIPPPKLTYDPQSKNNTPAGVKRTATLAPPPNYLY